jgi:hypothetical protein
MKLSVTATNVNATCTIMYILIYSNTIETYIYIIVKSKDLKNVIGY